MKKQIKVLFGALLLGVLVLGIVVTARGAYLSLTEQSLNLVMLKGMLTMCLPLGLVFAVSRLSSNWSRGRN